MAASHILKLGTTPAASRAAGLASTLSLLAIAAALPLAQAYAQEATEKTTRLERLVVTAAGSEQDLRDAPASVTLITAEEIEKLPAQDIRDILAKVQGVTLGRAGNANTVQIRGLGQRYTLFMIDGKRVDSSPNMFRGNDYDSAWVPLDAIERIEVVRGPMSSLYGSDAIGGVINVITKPIADAWHGSVTTEYTYQQDRNAGDSWRTGVFASGPLIKDKLGLKIYAGWDRRNPDNPAINVNPALDGFMLSDNKYIDATATWTPDVQNRIDFNYGYSHRNHQSNGPAGPLDYPMDRHSFGVSHFGDYSFGSSELKVWGDRVHNYQGHGNALGVAQPNTAYNAGVDGKMVFPVEWGVPQTITVGGSYRYQGIYDPFVLTGAGGPNSSVFNVAAFVEDEFRFTEKFLVTLGTRLDYHQNYGLNPSPRAYGIYHFTDALSLKGGYSRAFKAPTLLENSPNWVQVSCGGTCFMLGSTALKPETSDSFELGLYYDDPDWSASIVAFHNSLTNMIPFPPNRTANVALAPTYPNFAGFNGAGRPMFTYENVDRAQTQGVEASLAVRAVEDWTFTLNYTYLNARALSGVPRPLAYQPEHSANLGIEWQATDKLNLALNVSYVGAQYTNVPAKGNLAMASTAPAFLTADILAKYHFNEYFSLRGGVLNVGDNKVTRTVADDFNVDGRRFFLAATARF